MDVQNANAQRALTKGRARLDSSRAQPPHAGGPDSGPHHHAGPARGNLVDVGGTRNLQNTLVSIHGGRVETRA